MAAFKNDIGITGIHMKINYVKVYCPIGKVWYTGNYDVTFIPDQIIPDYIEIQDWVDKNLSTHELTIEQSCANLREYLNKYYNPHYVNIICNVNDAAHFEVKVITEV